MPLHRPPLLCLALAFTSAASAPLLVLPLPNSLQSTPGCLLLSPQFTVVSGGGGGSGDALLAAALARSASLVRSIGTRGESVLDAATLAGCAAAAGALPSLVVSVAAPRAAPYPSLQDDESYTLTARDGGATLAAASVWGALRGLETFSQLVSSDAAGAAARALYLPAARVEVADAPRWRHRGLMLDTGRAFLPLPVILAALDAMAYDKLNVLHWHISDDEAYPLASAVWPRLTAGAMQAPAVSHVYSAADVAAVVAAAQARGIRVMAELDVPGHASSWYAGYPALSTDCALPPGSAFTKPMDPTLDATYDFLAALLGEVQAAFPDALLHVGGDEVEMSCWANSSSVAAFMAARGIASFAQLQLYFETRLAAQLNATRRPVIWEGNSGAANAYPPGVIVEAWKERAGNTSVLEQLARQGFELLYTTPDWYLDWQYAGRGTDAHVNGPSEWPAYHAVDPLANSTLTPAQQALLLGGEVCAWSPYTDATNLMSTIFPRASAAAERLWSAAGAAVDEPEALAERMLAHRCRLVARNIAAAPTAWGTSCPNAFVQAYVPPY